MGTRKPVHPLRSPPGCWPQAGRGGARASTSLCPEGGSIGWIPLASKSQSALKISLFKIKRVRMEKQNILIFTDRTPGFEGKGMNAFLPNCLPLYRAEPLSWHPGAKAASQLNTERRNSSYSICLVAACLIHQSSFKHTVINNSPSSKEGTMLAHEEQGSCYFHSQ